MSAPAQSPPHTGKLRGIRELFLVYLELFAFLFLQSFNLLLYLSITIALNERDLSFSSGCSDSGMSIKNKRVSYNIYSIFSKFIDRSRENMSFLLSSHFSWTIQKCLHFGEIESLMLSHKFLCSVSINHNINVTKCFIKLEICQELSYKLLSFNELYQSFLLKLNPSNK